MKIGSGMKNLPVFLCNLVVLQNFLNGEDHVSDEEATYVLCQGLLSRYAWIMMMMGSRGAARHFLGWKQAHKNEKR